MYVLTKQDKKQENLFDIYGQCLELFPFGQTYLMVFHDMHFLC
jgi:hypothetical protein